MDACVLVPMPLCDTLLRLAEDPAMYRPLWSKEILRELRNALENKLHLTPEQSQRRIRAMHEAFPEALVKVPSALTRSLVGIPDTNDRHVLAAALSGQANAIITLNIRHFPAEFLSQYDILCQSPDDFLIHLFHLNPAQVLEKLDAQASAIRQGRPQIISRLRKLVPTFIAVLDEWSRA